MHHVVVIRKEYFKKSLAANLSRQHNIVSIKFLTNKFQTVRNATLFYPLVSIYPQYGIIPESTIHTTIPTLKKQQL